MAFTVANFQASIPAGVQRLFDYYTAADDVTAANYFDSIAKNLKEGDEIRVRVGTASPLIYTVSDITDGEVTVTAPV